MNHSQVGQFFGIKILASSLLPRDAEKEGLNLQ